MSTTTAAPLRSTQLEREQLAADLVGMTVRYTGRIAAHHGSLMTVASSHADTLALAPAGSDRPTLSHVGLDKIAPAR